MESSQNIRHDLEQNLSSVSLQSTPRAEREILPVHERPIRGRLEMRRRQRPSPKMWRLTLMIGDGLLLLASLTLSLLLAPLLHQGLKVSWNELETWNLKLIWECTALVAWVIAVSFTQAQDLDAASNRFKGPLKVLLALALMVVCWVLFIYPFIADRMASTIIVLLLFMVIAALPLSIWRFSLAELMNLPRFRRQLVIIGVNAAGETVARELRSLKRPTANLLGYISEGGDESIEKDGLPVLGDKGALRRLIHDGVIDGMIMAIDYKADPELFQEAIEAAQLGIPLIPMAMAYERMSGKVPVEHIGDQWYLALPVEIAVSPLYLCWRKVIDMVFALSGMAVLIFILPVLALLIRLDSPGPIFYKQERLGCNGRKFSMLKFRSMQTDAEQRGQAVWATRNDERVTRMGRFMRAIHLDELPQVFNILRGDMSLIGPRPEREAFVRELEKTIPFYRCRLMMKPGLTGWAQVKFSYANSDHDAIVKLQYDLYYIKQQSIMLDTFIILKTIVEVIACSGT